MRQLTDIKGGSQGLGALDDAGTMVYINSSTNQLGSNGDYRFQVFRFDSTSGAGEMLTSFNVGVTEWNYGVSVSDDGQWLAFISSGDLLGANHDMSRELFVMQTDGTQLSQLSSDPAPDAGSVTFFQMAGNGSSVVFVSTSDLTGGNPAHLRQIFTIGRDGTGLAQVTTADLGVIWNLGVSDDGQRIVFAADGDPTGGNPDGTLEIFAVDAAGSSLRQMTDSGSRDSEKPVIAGDGSRIAFESRADFLGLNTDQRSEIYVINWDGSGLSQVTQGANHVSAFPAITDDGAWIVFYSSQGFTYNIWKVRSDGTLLTQLTNLSGGALAAFPQVSGSGNRITALIFGSSIPGGDNPDGNYELHVMDGSGGNLQQLTVTTTGQVSTPDISPDGTRIVFVSRNDLTGSNPGTVNQIFRIQSTGEELAQITNFTGRTLYPPTIAADDDTIVFVYDGNPLGTNADLSTEVFKVRADGLGLAQLTSGSGYGTDLPEVSADGSVVVFTSPINYTGGNPDGSYEIFKVDIDGSGIAQLTSGPASGFSYAPRVDAEGTWCAFESTADLGGGNADGSWEVFRVRTDGTQLQQISSDPALDSMDPDISGDGDLVVYSSAADPLGTNPELNEEIFLYRASTAATLQLTSFTEGASTKPRIAQDGSFVYFFSDAPVFEDDPDDPLDIYGVEVATGEIVRVNAERGTANAYAVYLSHLSTDAAGNHAAFTGSGDFVQENPDNNSEVWLIDRAAPPNIAPSGAAPTDLSWVYESGPIRYDVIRGALDQIVELAGSVELGPVTCLENDSPDSNTTGYEDPDDPLPGEVFFYLYRGSQGLTAGPGSWGASSGGKQRIAGAGVCAP